MAYKVERWEGSSRSDEQIVDLFRGEGLSPGRWSNGPGDTYGEHSHSYRKVLYCVRGSIVFYVEGESVELMPGDRLDLEPGTHHSATVGREGVMCMEAQASVK